MALRNSNLLNFNALETVRCYLCRKLLSNYKSAISLSNLYPESTLNIASPVKVPDNSDSTFSGYIPVEKLNISYSRSSGPGGQHVNTTDTKVDVRFHVESASWLSKDIRGKLLTLFKNRVTKDGFFVVRSDKTRSQLYNQADALATLRQMVRTAAAAPPPPPSAETLHTIRKRKEKANMERLIEKRMLSMKKNSRRDDDNIF